MRTVWLRQIHSEVWPGVLAALKRAHIEDYSIYYEDESRLLFATMKYSAWQGLRD